MQITFSFRNVDSSDAVRNYASDKVARLQKFLRAPLSADVTISMERHLHVVDITITADGGRFAGREESDDMYSSIDLCLDKIDRQVREAKAGHGRKR
ncbi:MAG: ribosome-associated translation inhibitor RaiA [Myxococcales bacterium]|nr:ribosome-associated translation inhibitor RaiA [Myxococcales bacterium]